MTTFRNGVAIELEVPYHDVDMQGIVWHGHYLKYLELGRTAYFCSCKFDVDQRSVGAYSLFVIESRIRHSFPLRYGERFRIRTWCTDSHYRVRLAYEIWNLNHDRRSARAHIVLATIDSDGKLLYETPNEISSRLC